MDNHIWEIAEDTFLKHFCEIERKDLFSTYIWKNGGNWGKFNFTRIYNEVENKEDLLNIINSVKPKYIECDKTLSLKSSYDLSKFENLEEAGIPIVSMTIPKVNFETRDDVRLKKCETEEDMINWWAVNSNGRDRTGKSPLFPVILQIFQTPGNDFFLLTKEDENVACGAISHYQKTFNLWGLATSKAHQRNGYMKSLINEISNRNKCETYSVQVNLNSESWMYFNNIEGREVTNTERRYIEK